MSDCCYGGVSSSVTEMDGCSLTTGRSPFSLSLQPEAFRWDGGWVVVLVGCFTVLKIKSWFTRSGKGVKLTRVKKWSKQDLFAVVQQLSTGDQGWIFVCLLFSKYNFPIWKDNKIIHSWLGVQEPLTLWINDSLPLGLPKRKISNQEDLFLFF